MEGAHAKSKRRAVRGGALHDVGHRGSAKYSGARSRRLLGGSRLATAAGKSLVLPIRPRQAAALLVFGSGRPEGRPRQARGATGSKAGGIGTSAAVIPRTAPRDRGRSDPDTSSRHHLWNAARSNALRRATAGP